MKLRKNDIWLTVNRLGVPPPDEVTKERHLADRE